MSATGPRRSPLGLVAGLAVAVPALVVALVLSDVGGVLLCIAFGVPGVILAWRRPGQPIAWLLLLIAVGLTLGTVRTTASLEELTSGTMDRLGQITSWANGTGWTFVFGGILGLLLTFPSGHLPEGRWRLVSIV